MALEIAIAAIPNQGFTVTLDGHWYAIELKEANGVMVANVKRDDVDIVLGQRLVAGEFVLPFAYMGDANFFISTENEELPYYPAFGETQFLYYFTAAEVAEIRANG